jgi:type II secretory pathway component PulK
MVLVVVAVATLAAYSFTDTMLAFDDAANLVGDQVQTRAVAESAIEMTRLILSQSAEMRDSLGGTFNNPAIFQAIQVVPATDDARSVNFSIVAPAMNEMGRLSGIRYGLRNESSRLNLNALISLDKNADLLMPALNLISGDSADFTNSLQSRTAIGGQDPSQLSLPQSLLMSLPGMTLQIADSILDWLDEDSDPRPNGSELEYYSVLPTPYAPKNGPIDSVEELLLVRGVTPELLFGIDSNRNGVVDPAEQQRGLVDATQTSSLGWTSFLTVHGYESNKRRDGTPKIDVNQDDLEVLYQQLSGVIENPDYSSYIVAFRVGGQSSIAKAATSASTGNTQSSSQSSSNPGSTGDKSQQPAGAGGMPQSVNTNIPVWTGDQISKLDLTGGGTKLTQILDLIDSTVTIGGQSYRSPFTSDPLQMASYMPLLMDALSTIEFDKMPGRININECPAELLYGVPILEAETVEAILEARAQATESENRQYETWLLVEGVVTLDTMRTLTPLFTGGGDVFSAQIIAYYETSSTATRLEAVIDATGVNPRIASLRDLSHLGRGFDLSVLGLRTLLPSGP